MNPQQLLRELADMSVEDIGSVVDALAAGAWDEWDCGFGTFVELFGAEEWKVAAQSAAMFAESWAAVPVLQEVANRVVPPPRTPVPVEPFECRAPLCPNDGRCGCS